MMIYQVCLLFFFWRMLMVYLSLISLMVVSGWRWMDWKFLSVISESSQMLLSIFLHALVEWVEFRRVDCEPRGLSSEQIFYFDQDSMEGPVLCLLLLFRNLTDLLLIVNQLITQCDNQGLQKLSTFATPYITSRFLLQCTSIILTALSISLACMILLDPLSLACSTCFPSSFLMHSQMQALLQAMLTSQIRSPLPLISYLLTCYSFQFMLTTHLPKHRWKIRLCYLVGLLITFTSSPYSGVFLLRCRMLICYWVLQLQERMVPSCPNTNNLPPCMSLVLTAICFRYYSPLPLPHRYYFRRLHPLIPYICTFWYPISNCEASIPQLQHPIGVLYSILRSNLPDSMLHALITLLLSALASSSSVSLNIMCSTELSWYSMMPSAWYLRLLVSSVYWRGSYIYISPSIPPNAIYYPLLDMLMQVTLVSSAYLRIFSVLVISCSTSVSMVLHLPYSTEQDRLGIMTPLLASNFNAEVMRVSSLLRSTCWWVQLRIRPMMFSLRWRVGGLWYIAFCYVCSQMYYILRLLSRQSPNLAARHCLYTKWAAWNASLSMRSSRMSQYRSNRVSYDSVMQLSYLNSTSHLPSMIIDSKYFRSMMLRQICDSSCSVLQVWGKLFSCRNCKISWIICESLSSVVAGLWVACIYEHSIINYLSYKYLISTMYQNIENLKPQPAKCAKFIRMINLTTGALVVAFGLVGIIFMAIHNLFSLKFFLIFSPIFIIIFGVALLAIQLKSAFILENFGFLKTLLGRGLFNFYVSTEVYYYFSCSGTDNPVLAWTSSMVLFGIGVLYLVLHFTVGRGYANDLKQQLG